MLYIYVMVLSKVVAADTLFVYSQ